MFDAMHGIAYGAFALALGLFTAMLIDRLFPEPTKAGRNAAVDGLRGFLAFGVFIYHAATWRPYLLTGVWAPPTELYSVLGVNCVKVFFMITAYLFVGKLIDGRRRPIDWTALVLSRVLRLTPLYLLALATMFALVGALSGWALREPAAALAIQVVHWLSFSMLGMPDVNGVKTIPLLGVTWSLAYEWLFYLSLPLLAFAMRCRVPLLLVAGATFLLFVLAVNKPNLFFPTSFVTGALAAVVARNAAIGTRARRPAFSAVLLALALLAFTGHGSIPKVVLDACLGSAFVLVACGNTAWGLLETRVARLLGDISYGLYLLHCLLLFALFRFVVGLEQARTLSEPAHWGVICAASILLVAISATTYRFLEKPSVESVPKLRRWLQARRPGSKASAAA
jgi:peptidoglycan/LPS O-acetylase OafA/YrhL